jgi:hypothetical protein
VVDPLAQERPMNASIRTLLVAGSILSLLWTSTALAQGELKVEPLGETPLLPIPATMTFEEYEDMNRGFLKAFPYALFPGGMHFYANEDTTGWVLAGTVTAGIVLIIAGVGMMEEGEDFQESDFEIVNIGDKRFAKVPRQQEVTTTGEPTREITGETTFYDLQEVEKEPKGGGGRALVGIGALAIVGSYIYDIFHGMRTIEEKRNRVRFKYGVQMNAGVTLDPRNGEPRLTMDLRF